MECSAFLSRSPRRDAGRAELGQRSRNPRDANAGNLRRRRPFPGNRRQRLLTSTTRTDMILILLPNFLHHFGPEACTGLLKKVRRALAPGGRAFAVDFVPKRDRVSPPHDRRCSRSSCCFRPHMARVHLCGTRCDGPTSRIPGDRRHAAAAGPVHAGRIPRLTSRADFVVHNPLGGWWPVGMTSSRQTRRDNSPLFRGVARPG